MLVQYGVELIVGGSCDVQRLFKINLPGEPGQSMTAIKVEFDLVTRPQVGQVVTHQWLVGQSGNLLLVKAVFG